MAALDSPVIGSIVGPILTLLALALLRYAHKEITGAIESTKQSVLKEVRGLESKVDDVILEQSAVRDELKKHQEDAFSVKERVARLEGRRDAQIEAAQIASAAAVAVDVITHREQPT